MTILGALMGFLLLSGTAAAPAPVAVPARPTYSVAMTAYNAVPDQTDESPFETASGAYSNPEVVAARSQDLAEELPFGSIIEVDGPAAAQESCGYGAVSSVIGYRVIADTMNARFTNRVDVLLDETPSYTTADKGMKNAAEVFGICKDVTIRVVGHVSVGRIPKTQKALVALVASSTQQLAVK